jgi:hypothetical protein
MKIKADFSIQTLINTRSKGNDIFEALKQNNCQPRLVYPAKLSFIIEREIKTSHNKQKLKGLHDHLYR